MISIGSLVPAKKLPKAGEHLIACVRGSLPGPTLVILGSIHGNEPSGALAAERALPELQKRIGDLRGEIVLLRGNTRALAAKVRYVDADLNRQWTNENVRSSETGKKSSLEISELVERRELIAVLREALNRARGEVYFLDLHTTSAEGKPFATVGDTLRNRRFALHFPVTIVLGLEEQIDGTLLEYFNNLGAVTMGFEAGQHDAVTSIDNHEAVIWIAAAASGNFRAEDLVKLDHYQSELKRAGGGMRVIEVRHRHPIAPADSFQMKPGFRNFQPVERGQILASDRTGEIKARESGLMLMPLYQKLGDDGFFLARDVKQFWIYLSEWLRRLMISRYVHLLPGVRRDPSNDNFFIINTRIARLLPLQVFHLLGFRRRRWIDNELVVSRRAHDLKGPATVVL